MKEFAYSISVSFFLGIGIAGVIMFIAIAGGYLS